MIISDGIYLDGTSAKKYAKRYISPIKHLPVEPPIELHEPLPNIPEKSFPSKKYHHISAKPSVSHKETKDDYTSHKNEEPERYRIVRKKVKKYIVSDEAKRKAMMIAIENQRRTLFSEKNIQVLRDFGWSEEKIRQWKAKEEARLRELEKKVRQGYYDPKIVEHFAKKGLIPAKVVEETIEEKIPVSNKKYHHISSKKEHKISLKEQLMKVFKKHYGNTQNVIGADWSVDMTHIVKQVYPNATKAVIYGKYQILSYKKTSRTYYMKPEELLKTWKKGYAYFKIPLEKGYYIIKVPAKLKIEYAKSSKSREQETSDETYTVSKKFHLDKKTTIVGILAGIGLAALLLKKV